MVYCFRFIVSGSSDESYLPSAEDVQRFSFHVSGLSFLIRVLSTFGGGLVLDKNQRETRNLKRET